MAACVKLPHSTTVQKIVYRESKIITFSYDYIIIIRFSYVKKHGIMTAQKREKDIGT